MITTITTTSANSNNNNIIIIIINYVLIIVVIILPAFHATAGAGEDALLSDAYILVYLPMQYYDAIYDSLPLYDTVR